MLQLARFHAQRQPSLGELTTTRTVCISKVDIFASNSILYNKCADEKLTAVELLAAGRPAAGQRVNGKKSPCLRDRRTVINRWKSINKISAD